MSGLAYSFDLTYPPSANRLWRVSNGVHHKSAEYAAWKAASSWMVRAKCPQAIDGPFSIRIAAVRPDKRRRDLDNLLKPILDAAQAGGAITDDRHAQRIEMAWVENGPAIHVMVIAAMPARDPGGSAA